MAAKMRGVNGNLMLVKPRYSRGCDKLFPFYCGIIIADARNFGAVRYNLPCQGLYTGTAQTTTAGKRLN